MTAQLLTPAEAAQRLRKHTKTVRQMIHTGELPAITNGLSGSSVRYYVPETAVAKWIRDHAYHPEI